MPRPSQPSPKTGSRRQSRRPNAKSDAALQRLEKQFAKFRREHPPQTRIPDTLRRGVLAAMRQGVTTADLRRYCGLSSTQLTQWQQGHTGASEDVASASRPARVFSVVNENREPGDEPAVEHRDRQLELRLDGWSICIRRLGPQAHVTR